MRAVYPAVNGWANLCRAYGANGRNQKMRPRREPSQPSAHGRNHPRNGQNRQGAFTARDVANNWSGWRNLSCDRDVGCRAYGTRAQCVPYTQPWTAGLTCVAPTARILANHPRTVGTPRGVHGTSRGKPSAHGRNQPRNGQNRQGAFTARAVASIRARLEPPKMRPRHERWQTTRSTLGYTYHRGVR